MRVLLFSDFHNAVSCDALKQALFNQPVPDVILTLGDISVPDLMFIKTLFDEVPMYGVCGNHDSQETLNTSDIPNLHGKVVELDGVRFAGFGGSVRYKRGAYTMFSQNESVDIVRALPEADVLISHDKAFNGVALDLSGEVARNSHEGMAGITSYLRENKPFLHVHGHIHENKRYGNEGAETICVYGAAVITIENREIVDYRVLLEV